MMSEPNGYDPDVIMMKAVNTLVAAAAVLETAVELARKTGLKKVEELYDAESWAARWMAGVIAVMIAAESPGSSDTDRAIVPIASGLADDAAAKAAELWAELLRDSPADNGGNGNGG